MPPQEPQQPNTTPSEPVAPTPATPPSPDPVQPASVPSAAPEVSTAPQAAPMSGGASNPAHSNEDPGHTLGIVGLVLPFFSLSLIGFIVSLIARSKSKKAGHKNTIATIGIVVNLLFMLVSTLIFVLITIVAVQDLQTAAGDIEAQNDINMQQAALETYYAKNGNYPRSLDTLTELSTEAVTTPEGYTYVYGPTPAGCTECTGYTLETQLSTGEVYRKEALNSF